MVPPGLYAIGTPMQEDPVLVTANYKMTYDIVRNVLVSRNVWLLVLETYGINVWCAAGKGTFGTDELVRRIEISGLSKVVTHRQLILPVLGAPGVAAYEVKSRTGFSIRYAAIRAADLPEYLDNGMITTPAMRELTFTLWERLVLIPVELASALKPTAIAAVSLFAVFAALYGFANGFRTLFAYLGAVLTGIVITPLLLPWLPGRSFAFKGVVAGVAWSIAFYLLGDGETWSMPVTAAAFLSLPTVSAFYALNFTGCTNYTSRSGVKKELRMGMPAMVFALIASFIIVLWGRFL